MTNNYTGPIAKSRPWPIRSTYRSGYRLPQNGGLPDAVSNNTNDLSVVGVDLAQTYKVKNWKNIIRQGGQAAAPYDRQWVECFVEPGSATVEWLYPGSVPPRNASSYFNGCDSLNYPAAVEVGGYIQADNQALSRFYTAIRQEYQHMQSLIFIGELGETVRMFKRPFAAMQGIINGYLHNFDVKGRKVVSFYRRRKRNTVPLVKHLNHAAAEAWLEASFGIRPLISDVVSGAETLARFIDNGRERRTQVQGFGTSTSNGVVGSVTVTNPASFVYGRQTSMDKTTWVVKYRAGVNGHMSGPDGSLYRLRSLVGFTPEEFVPTVWNLLPWSFLADYFFNVGQVLNSTWTNTSSVTWAIKSDLGKTVRQIQNMVDHKLIRTNLGASYRSSTGAYLWKLKSERNRNTRTILNIGALPLPLYDSKSFSEWNPLKVANVVALLKTKARGISGNLLTTSRG
jgi:hypothetical protein